MPIQAGSGPLQCDWRRIRERLVEVLAAEVVLPEHESRDAVVASMARALTAHLLTLSARPSRSPAPPGTLSERALQQTRRYIDNHIGERISLADLARAAGVSRFHFARQFRRRTGESPMEFLLRLRIDRAKTLLEPGDARVVDVAAALGFADQSHFTRTFRRVVGVPPSVFMRPRQQVA